MSGIKLNGRPLERGRNRPKSRGGDTASLLEALENVYGRVGRHLRKRIDECGTDVREIGRLGQRYAWISDRYRMVNTMLHSEPMIRDYVCAEGAYAAQLDSLIASAEELSRRPADLETTLAFLEYIDHELGWALPARAA
jgi:hypothetical protein